jgi:hypothetical protein
MSRPTDVEISRALNALSTTLRDQRPPALDPARIDHIATGALAGERKYAVRQLSPTSAELRTADGDLLVAVIGQRDGQWTVERKLRAGGSSWALPQPAHGKS